MQTALIQYSRLHIYI